MSIFIARGEVISLLKSTDKAILIHNIAHWIEVNKANNKNFHDGYFWTYNSTTAFSKLFPFWTSSKIQKLLKNLENDGYLKSANYNKIAYDRTKWYTIVDSKLIDIYKLNIEKTHKPKSKIDQNHSPDLPNGLEQISQPIPDINTNINQKKKKKEKSFSKPTIKEVESYGIEKAREMNKKFNPLVFFNYYEANNWQGVKNWKQRLVNWLGRESATFQETKKTRISKGEDYLLDLGDL